MGVTFFVPGTPVAKGSGKAFYNRKKRVAYVVQDNAERQEPWVSLISYTAQQLGLKPDNEPKEVRLEFHMPRPKSHYNSKGEVKPGAPFRHVTTPDLDKLQRAVLDALTMLAWNDDKQVFRIQAWKHYSETPGVEIELR